MLRIAVLALAALTLAACGAIGTRFAYIRADGQDLASDPALARQFNTDRMSCQAEGHRTASIGDPHYDTAAAQGGDVVQDCMENKGYIVVLERDADAKQQELAAKAAEKARREAEAAAPPPPPPPPPPHKPKHKTKPKPPVSPPASQTSPK